MNNFCALQSHLCSTNTLSTVKEVLNNEVGNDTLIEDNLNNDPL